MQNGGPLTEEARTAFKELCKPYIRAAEVDQKLFRVIFFLGQVMGLELAREGEKDAGKALVRFKAMLEGTKKLGEKEMSYMERIPKTAEEWQSSPELNSDLVLAVLAILINVLVDRKMNIFYFWQNYTAGIGFDQTVAEGVVDKRQKFWPNAEDVPVQFKDLFPEHEVPDMPEESAQGSVAKVPATEFDDSFQGLGQFVAGMQQEVKQAFLQRDQEIAFLHAELEKFRIALDLANTENAQLWAQLKGQKKPEDQ